MGVVDIDRLGDAPVPRLNFAAFRRNFRAVGRSRLKADAESATICQWYSCLDLKRIY